jgi:DNA-directed RNA polymerase subunit RPC12/RpoP
MKCQHCGSKRWSERMLKARRIMTLGGAMIENRISYQCADCFRHTTENSDIAPHWGRYAWDVIEMLFRLREEGMTYEKIKTHFAKKYGIHMAVSTAATIIQRYGDKK